MAKLKAFVRYDGMGRIVPGSLILQRNAPKVGNWDEVNSTLCCNPTPSTTKVAVASCTGISPCSGRCTIVTVYMDQACADNPQAGCQVWSDASGTTLVPDGEYAVTLPGSVPGYMSIVGGVITIAASCG